MLKRFVLLLSLVFFLLCETAGAKAPERSVERIHAALMERPWAISDREELVEQRSVRAMLMARSLYDAVQELDVPYERSLLAATISIWWWETRFSLSVHRGGLSRWGSDDGRAKCFGQVHVRAVGIKRQDGESLEAFRDRQQATWESLAGTDYESTKECALATMRQYLSKLKQCRETEEPWLHAFGAYGHGELHCGLLPTSQDRFRLMKQLFSRL